MDFPLEGLDLGKYCLGGAVDGSNVPLLYDLVAVSEHHGGLGGGHYTAIARSSIDGKWYKFDDNYVTEARIPDVVTGAGYVLFYLRRDLLQKYMQEDWSGACASNQDANATSADDTTMNCDDTTMSSEPNPRPDTTLMQPFFEEDYVMIVDSTDNSPGGCDATQTADYMGM